MRKYFNSLFLPLMVFISCLPLHQLLAQGIISSDGGSVIINFDNSTPGILNGAFTAAGIFGNPPPGGLDGDGVLIDDDLPGAADQPVVFGANDAPFRYVSSGNVSSFAPGIWAFDVNANSGRTLGFQPESNHFGSRDDKDGHVVFKFVNNSGVTLTAFQVQYDMYEVNDGDLNTAVQTYLTTDVSTPNFGPIRDSYLTSGYTNLTAAWNEGEAREFSVVSGINVPDGEAVYLRFHIFNGPSYNGFGYYDELAIDNIKIVGASSTEVLFPCELPVAKCKSAVINLDDAGMATLLPENVDDSSTADCGLGLATVSPNTFDCSNIGSNSVTLSIRDIDGNTSSCSTTVIVEDKVSAAARCRDLTIQLDASGNASTSIGAVDSGSTDACGIASQTLSKSSFDCSNVGPNAVTLTITDNNDNISSCTSIITIEDISDPTAQCKNITIQLDANGTASTTAAAVDNGSGDACGIITRTLSKSSFDCSNVGPNTVTLTVADPSGLQDQCTATVTVEDYIVPVLTCPSNKIFIPNTENCSFIPGREEDSGVDFNLRVFSYTQYNPFGTPVLGSVYDNCTQLQLSNDFNNSPSLINAEFPIGVTTVSYTVTDAGNNTVSCSFTVEIEANSGEAPKLVSCPPQLQGTPTAQHLNVLEYFVEAGTCGKTLSFDDPIFTDCDAFTISRVGGYPSGSEFPTGTTDFYFRAVDEQGNRSDNLGGGPACTTRIIVKEAIAPVAKCKENLTIELDNSIFSSNGGTIRPTDLDNGSFDECGGGLTLRILKDGNRYLDWVLYCDDYAFQPLTLEVTDRFGNASTCTTQVKLGEQPTAVCKGIQVDVGGGNRTISPVDIYAGVAFSPCVERFPPTMSLDRNLFGCGDVGEQITTLTLTDVLGITTTCTSKITVVDGFVSTLNCGSVQVKLENGDQRTIDISNYYSASDACTDVTVIATQDMVTLDCDDYGENLVLITATDGNGNTRTCNVRINVYSEWAPTCEDLTVNLDANGEAIINHRAIFSYGDLCPTDPNIPEYNQNLRYDVRNRSGGDGFLEGGVFTQDYTFTLTSNDVGVNRIWFNTYDINTPNDRQDCSSYITVIDNPAPEAVCKNTTVYLDDQGSATLTVADVDGGSYDENGTIVSSVLDITSFGCSDVQNGPQTVTLTVTDDGGRSDACSAIVEVTGSQACCGDGYVFSLELNACIDINECSEGTSVCPPNSICVNTDGGYECDCLPGFTKVDGLCVDVDECLEGIANCPPNSICVNTEGSYECDCLPGFTKVDGLCVDIDECAEGSANCPPNSICVNTEGSYECVTCVTPICQNITVQVDGQGYVSITAAEVDGGSSTACGSISNLSLDNTGFNCSNIGTNTVTLTVTDNNGNAASCTATVTVQDQIAPVANAQDITVQLDASGNANITATDIDNGSSDACGIASLDVSPDSFDCSNIGPNTVTLTVTDAEGHVGTATATVTVADNMAPVANCQPLTVQLNENGSGNITAQQVDKGSADACGIANLSLSQQSFGCEQVGTQTVTLTVTDLNGNSSSCEASVEVKDEVAPVAQCQPMTVQLDENGSGTITAQQVNNGSADACGVANLSLSQQSFGCSEVGTQTVTLTVTDLNGNSSTCEASVEVKDEVAPVAQCQPMTVQLDENGSGAITTQQIDNGSSDACGIANLSLSQQSFGCSEVGTQTVTLTVTDINGNSSSCDASVTVVDEIKPTLTCPQDILVNTDQGTCGAGINFTLPTVSDNCSIQSIKARYRSVDNNTTGAWSSSMTDPSGFFQTGRYQVQWSAVDQSGNESSCSHYLEITDEEAPDVVCQDIDVSFNGETSITVLPTAIFSAAESFDACGPVTFIHQSQSIIDCSEVGNTLSIEVTAQDPNGNTNTCTALVTVGGMPCGFTQTGIGCEIGANTQYDAEQDQFTITSEGCFDYPGESMAFTGTNLCGDGEVLIHLAGVNGAGYAGIVMRENLDPGARMVGIASNLTTNVRVEYRVTTGGNLFRSVKRRSGAEWFKIVRIGNKFKSYTSTNGTNWKLLRTTNFSNMSDCMYVGIQAYSINRSAVFTATIDEFVITANGSASRESAVGIPQTAPVEVGIQAANYDLGISPNPFSSQAMIQFYLPETEEASLAIFNLQGQLVRQLDKGLLKQGHYQTPWDGTNQAGTQLSSGIYWLQLRVGEIVLNEKVVLQRR